MINSADRNHAFLLSQSSYIAIVLVAYWRTLISNHNSSVAYDPQLFAIINTEGITHIHSALL